MYKHLVVAVDGSTSSLKALEHASGLAVQGNSKLTLVNVANPTEYMTLAPEFLQHESYEAAAVANSNLILEEATAAAKAAGVVDVGTHLLIAIKGAKEMAQELVDYAVQQGADLIVMGTHGRSGLMHVLMGSFAETVMRRSSLPLLIIRSQEKDEE